MYSMALVVPYAKSNQNPIDQILYCLCQPESRRGLQARCRLIVHKERRFMNASRVIYMHV